MSKSAIYARVSSEEQRERQTIETQLAEVRRYCEARGITNPVIYADDGVSGTIPFDQRPGGAKLLADAASGKVSTVVVYKLDRVGRDVTVILDAIRRLEKLGAEIVAATESLDSTTPGGRFTTTIFAAVAQLERENIKERATAGLRRLARAGAWIVPYGYRVEGKRSDARLMVSEEPVPGTGLTEADVVREIFRLVGDEGMASTKVADHLDRIGVPPAYRLESRGKRMRTTSGRWRDERVRYVVRNSAYRGAHPRAIRPAGG